ncbi:hypothetical protein ID866_3393 [Astraeus odoratus]|nr:hypothetical protein ID866_3393 [Astraeus odoratus]
MFSWLLSCCGRRRKQQHDPEAVPNERTPIIPATEDAPMQVPHSYSSVSVYTHPLSRAQLRVVDHQRLKERLGSVLKSKETYVPSPIPHPPVPRKAAGAQGPTNDRGRMLRHGELPVISGMGSEDGLPRGSDDATQESTNRDNWATPAHPQPSLSAQGPPPQEVLIDLALDQNVVDIPRSPESFTIHDAGAVSRSWRD